MVRAKVIVEAQIKAEYTLYLQRSGCVNVLLAMTKFEKNFGVAARWATQQRVASVQITQRVVYDILMKICEIRGTLCNNHSDDKSFLTHTKEYFAAQYSAEQDKVS
eukprot:PhF_6_TR12807/c0_g2_i1/m.20180